MSSSDLSRVRQRSPAASGGSVEAVLPLSRGDVGAAVRDIQERLAHALDVHLQAHGRFDDDTFAAVRRLQRERGLGADGVVGPETWRSLVEAAWRLGDRLLWHASRMLRGDDVLELQHRLNQLGFDAGQEDGIYGPLAAEAVEEFQRNVGLQVDGVAGQQVVETLRRLHRSHHTSQGAAGVRERESLRRLATRGLVGARLLIDPAHGPDDPGHRGLDGLVEHELTWALATRLGARLSAHGAHVLLSRGPLATPTNHTRARLANEQGVHATLSLAISAHPTPTAGGASAYYFGAPRFTSEAGRHLAQLLQEQAVEAGWAPDCRTHPQTWTLLRETRMPTVVLEPGYLTSPVDAARLADPAAHDLLAARLTAALARFFDAEVMAQTAPAGR